MKESAEPYSNFAFRIGLPVNSWLEDDEVFENFERMREAIAICKFIADRDCFLIVEKHPKLAMSMRFLQAVECSKPKS